MSRNFGRDGQTGNQRTAGGRGTSERAHDKPFRTKEEDKLRQEIDLLSEQVKDLNFEFGEEAGKEKASAMDAGGRLKGLLAKVQDLGFENFELEPKKEKKETRHFYIYEDLEVDVDSFKLLRNDLANYRNLLFPVQEKLKNDFVIYEEQAVNKILKDNPANDVKHSLFKRVLAEHRLRKLEKTLAVYNAIVESLSELEELRLETGVFAKEYQSVNKLLNSEFHMLRVKAQVNFRDLLKEQIYQSKNYDQVFTDFVKRVEYDYAIFVAEKGNKDDLLRARAVKDLGDDPQLFLDSGYSPFL